MESRPKIRLFVDAPLSDGGDIVLSDPQAHYLTHVMRARPGSRVLLFNGLDGEWLAELTATSKRQVRLILRQPARPPGPTGGPWLLFAPVKRARIDFIVEKATELGVSAFLPVDTAHTMIERVNHGRLRAIATEASEQCGRLDVPTIAPTQSLDAALAAWPTDRCLYYLDETGGGRPVAAVLAETMGASAAFLVGPEGGFTKTELDGLQGLAFSAGVGLGPRILRADTAVIAALACYQALCGDWQRNLQPPS